jgi:hypothetical protein
MKKILRHLKVELSGGQEDDRKQLTHVGLIRVLYESRRIESDLGVKLDALQVQCVVNAAPKDAASTRMQVATLSYCLKSFGCRSVGGCGGRADDVEVKWSHQLSEREKVHVTFPQPQQSIKG